MTVTPRYNVNANRAAAEIINEVMEDGSRLMFVKSETPNRNGAIGRMKVVSPDTEGSVGFYKNRTSGGSKLTQKATREAGLKARHRYRLRKGGKNWFWIEPHSRFGKKPVVTEDPVLSVNITRS